MKNNSEYDLKYSMCATYLKPNTSSMAILYDFLTSKNGIQFKGLAKSVSWPTLNFVFADTSNNIGWTTNGLVPIHNEPHNYDPTLVLPGWLSKYTWNKYIPKDIIPESLNPENGYCVSCNNAMVDNTKYPYFLGCYFAVGYRAQRATEMIQSNINNNNKIDINYCKSMQLDIYDLSAKDLIENVLKKININDIKINEKYLINSYIIMKDIHTKEFKYDNKENYDKIKLAYKYLMEWNYKADKDSIHASIYYSFIYCMVRHVIINGINNKNKNDNLSENIFKSYNKAFNGLNAMQYKMYGFIIKILKDNNKKYYWINNFGDKYNLIAVSLIDCIHLLKYYKGDNINEWKWGNLHYVCYIYILYISPTFNMKYR